jgi:hypothetical protein
MCRPGPGGHRRTRNSCKAAVLRERMLAGCIRSYSPWWTRGGPAQRGAHAGRRTEIARTGTTPAERRHARRRRRAPPPVEQEGAGGRRTPVDGSDRSGLGLGRRAARRGALRARTPPQNRRAATHATRSGARGAQKLPTAPSGRKPGTQAARRSRAMVPPSRSDGAARTSAAVDRSGPAVEARDQPPGESVRDHARRSSCPPLARPRTPFGWGPKGRWFKSSRPDYCGHRAKGSTPLSPTWRPRYLVGLRALATQEPAAPAIASGICQRA